MKAVKKILIADDVHELLIEGLTNLGWEPVYRPLISREELKEEINAVHGLVIRTKTRIDREILDKAPLLEFVARAGAGLDNIDTDYAAAKNVLCFNAGEANADAVGEHTIGMLLMLLNNLARADREVRNKIWHREENRGHELAGKKVGIVGYGNTGRAFARKLSGFDVEVFAYDKYLSGYTDRFATACDMDKLFEEADIVSFHLPLSAETKGMVNVDFLGRFRKKIFLLNLSRGGIVNTMELVEALKDEKIAGVALDVLENEELQTLNEKEREWFGYLAKSERVVLSPHIGGWTFESYRKISAVILRKIQDITP